MSGFRFGLQRVLDLREHEQEQVARALADAERWAREAADRMKLMARIRDEEAAKLSRAHTEGRSVGQLQNLAYVVKQLTERVRAAETAAREADEAVDRARAELVDALKQRRVMDQLRDRQQAAWLKDETGRERKRMDELALGIFQRRTDAKERGS